MPVHPDPRLVQTILMTTPSVLGSHKIMAFVATRDFAAARKFYRDALGLHLVSEDPFALVFDALGTMLRVTAVQSMAPAPYTILGLDVPDISATVNDLQNPAVTPQPFQGPN